jgi:hypothetical protein
MIIIVVGYLVLLATLVVVPTIPSSRRLRVILGVVAVLIIIFGYHFLDAVASRVGASQFDRFVNTSERLIRDGRVDIVLDAFERYHIAFEPELPHGAGAAVRAYRLTNRLETAELEAQLREKRAAEKSRAEQADDQLPAPRDSKSE